MKLYVESLPNVELEGTVYSVGKTFEENPKAIHIHVNIDNKQGLLIPGMYVRGKVILDDILSLALPEEAVVKEGDKSFVFLAEKDGDSWELEPMEVIVGKSDNGWLEIRLLKQLNENQLLALNSAYYLMAEMKKGEAEHSH
jgi:cobalt-zinc-cadmium efflux system membrane fusion protein